MLTREGKHWGFKHPMIPGRLRQIFPLLRLLRFKNVGVPLITVDIRFQDYALKKCANLLIKALRFIDSHVLDKCISRG